MKKFGMTLIVAGIIVFLILFFKMGNMAKEDIISGGFSDYPIAAAASALSVSIGAILLRRRVGESSS